MSRLLIIFLGVIIVSLFLVGERPKREAFTDFAGLVQIIKAFLKDIQYQKGRIIIGFYQILLVNRVRRLRSDGDTTLNKDIYQGVIDEIKKRSRWDNFEPWIISCTTTAGTPMEDNLISRTASLPVDHMNYLRFMNTIVTMYRDEFALLRNKKPVGWRRREIDEGTAQDDYKPPAKAPTAINEEMQKYLTEHLGQFDKIWPTIEKIAVKLTQQATDMNDLLLAREKMPNGFTMRIYVDFEEKVFQKPLADVLKFMIDTQAEAMMYDKEGKKQMSLEKAKIATTMELVRLAGIDFTPWFVPIYKGKVGSYEDRFKAMTFDPSDYLRLGEFCVKGLQEQLRIVRDSLATVTTGKKENFVGQVEVDDLLFEPFAPAGAALAPEDRPFLPQVRDVINKRFLILGQIEDTFKKQIAICNGVIAEFKKIEDSAAAGKFRPALKIPFGDNQELPETVSLTKNRLPVGDAL